MFGFPTRRIRILVQAFVFTLWVMLILATKNPMDSMITKYLPVSLLLRIDPLVMTAVSGGMRMGITITMLGFVTLGITLLLGRVFCGWVCPFGAIFDVTGWFLRRMRVRFEGPSPSWFRLKYYILLAIILFALFGAVSPLMGLDPIVIVTRVAATVLGGAQRHWDDFRWGSGATLGNHGHLVDGLTLLLFLTVMGATTKMSRIWCRTTCPLGAYLAISSRNSVLRRDTTGCVHCNICSSHCPTGAISFENAEVYNESECIKCFNCSSECPVDANYFTYKLPFPTVSKSQHPVSLGRREVLTTTAAVVAATPLLKLSGGGLADTKRLIRPPMSREEPDFLLSCIRCAECMKACPSGILKPAGLEHGLRALWTPVMTPIEGACQKGCNACSQACPTDAIMKYPIEKKYTYKAGTATFLSNNCISYSENKFCSECVRVCPTDAIVSKEDWKPEGATKGVDYPAPEGRVPTRPIGIRFESCVGCGACEYVCNQIVLGPVAMLTTSFGRAAPTSLEPH